MHPSKLWVGALALYTAAAFAQSFPDRSVRIVIPQLPGGSSDVIGRIIAEQLTEKWKQPVIIENKTGANGNIGTDFVAKSKPGELNYGAQTGSLNHLMIEMLNQSTGMKTVFIPYRGAPDSLTATISGLLQFNYSSLGSVIGHIRGGTVRPLAVTSSRRSPQLKDVPTVAESGFPDLTTDSWWGLFVPAGTPPDIVKKIDADVNELLKRPDVVRRFGEFGAEPFVTTPEQFAKIAHDDMGKFRIVLEKSSVNAE